MFLAKSAEANQDIFYNFITTDLKLARFPRSLAATLRGFTFYLAVPINSIRGRHGLGE
jgi:hypothetical protein